MTALPSTISTPTGGLREHVAHTLRLAMPVIVARCGLLVLIAVDTAMTGHAGGSELAAYGLSMAPQVPMMLFGVGLLMGVVVLCSQAVGAGRESDCGKVYVTGLAVAAATGLMVMLLCYAGEPMLRAAGQSESLARASGAVLVMFGFGMPGLFMFTATVFFLEGINRPTAGMVVMLLANLLNVGLNWLLVYGNLGLPALGAEGAALATSLVRWFMFLAAFGYVLLGVDRHRYGLDRLARAARGGRDFLRRIRRVGLPTALAMVVESGAFSAMLLLAGSLGEVQVAAYQVAMNLSALTFMTAIGFGTAASVRVGNAVGRSDMRGVRLAGWTAVTLGGMLLCLLAVMVHFGAAGLAAIYTADAAVLAVAIPTFGVTALSLGPDGLQGVIMGALRGAADTWPATLLYLFSFWVVMVPVGYLLGVHLEGGAPGLMIAVLVGGTVASLSLGLRFNAVTRRQVSRV